MSNLEDIKKAIYESGLTRCESQDCVNCEFDKKSPESKELGNVNICILLNDIYRTK
jgi:hypothetical protein